jgi:hypothetical protein
VTQVQLTGVLGRVGGISGKEEQRLAIGLPPTVTLERTRKRISGQVMSKTHTCVWYRYSSIIPSSGTVLSVCGRGTVL